MSVVRDPPTGSGSGLAPVRDPHERERDAGRLRAHPRDGRDRDLTGVRSFRRRQAAISMLVTALVFWLAHVYARLLGTAVSHDRGLTRAAVLGPRGRTGPSLRSPSRWCSPVAGRDRRNTRAGGARRGDRLGAGGVGATGAYAAISHGASPAGTLASAVIVLALGTSIVLLKVRTSDSRTGDGRRDRRRGGGESPQYVRGPGGSTTLVSSADSAAWPRTTTSPSAGRLKRLRLAS